MYIHGRFACLGRMAAAKIVIDYFIAGSHFGH